jgi:hypothetical protein
VTSPRARDWRRPIGAVAAIAIAGLLFRLLLPDRSDYAGHFLAGAGGTLLLLTVVLATGVRAASAVVAVMLVAILLGTGTEATIFKLAQFDPVDLAVQSLGAVLACSGFVQVPRRPPLALASVAGVAYLVAGFGFAFA